MSEALFIVAAAVLLVTIVSVAVHLHRRPDAETREIIRLRIEARLDEVLR